MYDFGYDITDYRQIATEYGTMEDFDNLMVEAKKNGKFDFNSYLFIDQDKRIRVKEKRVRV